MSKSDKLLAEIQTKPKNYTDNELKRLLLGLQCIEDNGGKTSGSRVVYIYQPTQAILRLHRPHPGHALKTYQIELVLEFLKSIGVI